jgi:hypothetical protein
VLCDCPFGDVGGLLKFQEPNGQHLAVFGYVVLAPGFQADLVATEANPLEVITAVRRVVLVMKGSMIYRNETPPGNLGANH